MQQVPAQTAQPMAGKNQMVEQPKKSKWLKWAIIALVIIVIGLAAYYFFG